jgi:hypothetical protein
VRKEEENEKEEEGDWHAFQWVLEAQKRVPSLSPVLVTSRKCGLG